MPGRAARASHSMPREQSHVVRRIMRQAYWSTRHNHTRAQDEDIIHVLYCKSVSVSLTVYSMGDPLIITYNYDCLFGVSLQSQHILAYGVRHVEVSLYLSVQAVLPSLMAGFRRLEKHFHLLPSFISIITPRHTHPIARFLYCPSLLVFASPLHISAVHVSRTNKIGTSDCRPSALPTMGVNEYRSGSRKA